MHPAKTYHRKPMKGERVWTEVVRMSDIPAGDDPTAHDTHNQVTALQDGWVAMHAQAHGANDDRGLSYVNLVNGCTGQRFEILLWPELVVPDNKAGAHHAFHLSFSTLGGAHYVLGYDLIEDAVASMVELSTYRNVFRLNVMRRGMTPVEINWLAGDKILTDLDQYHQAVSWGDSEVVLARHGEDEVHEAWMEPDEQKTMHMCIICPACGSTIRSLQDMRGSNVTHQCSETKLNHIWVGNDVKVLMEKPAIRPDLPTA